MVRGQQRLEYLAVAMGQVSLVEVASGSKATGHLAGQVGRHEFSPFVARQDQQRVVAQLIADLRFDVLVLKVGIRVGIADASVAAAEADAPLADVLNRENPAKAIKRAFVQMGVVLHGTFDTRDHGRLGAAVGAVEQNQSIGPSFAGKIGDQAIDGRLNFLLAAQAVLAIVPGAVEKVEAGGFASWTTNLGCAEVVEDIAHVLGRGTDLPGHVLVEQADVLAIGYDSTCSREAIAHLGG
jgi:hypothetical protein